MAQSFFLKISHLGYVFNQKILGAQSVWEVWFSSRTQRTAGPGAIQARYIPP